MQHSEWEQKYSMLIAKAWTDEAFKKRFLANPAAVMKERGLEVPYGVEVKIVESTPNLLYLVLPPKPTEELSEEDLLAIVAQAAPPYTWCHQCKVDEPGER
jgi:hypothetical protein